MSSARSRRGYGIHSPFAYEFVREIINPEKTSYYYCFEGIEQCRYQLKKNHKTVLLDSGKTTSVASLIKTSAREKHKNQLLFRTALHLQARTLVEVVNKPGLSSAYMACADKSAQLISLTPNHSIQSIAEKTSSSLKIKNITHLNGKINKVVDILEESLVQPDLLYFNTTTGIYFLSCFNQLKTKGSSKSVYVFDHIHSTKEKYQAWQKIVADPLITLSLECYDLGLAFTNPELNKQHHLV